VAQVSLKPEPFSLKQQLQVPPLRSPGFPVEIRGVDRHRVVFLEEKPHTWSLQAARGRKSGYAPVGMTRVGLLLTLTSGHLDGRKGDQLLALRYSQWDGQGGLAQRILPSQSWNQR
jgi:hypothetical protein